LIDLKNTRNIILDLGGVVLDLDVDRTVKAFSDLGFPQLEDFDIILSRYPFFLDFETGNISTDEFIETLLKKSRNHVSEEKILNAWNAMILGFRQESIDLLLNLRKEYRIFLLSNTNAIHEIYYNRKLKYEHGIENLDRIFEKVYYSHNLKMRKPNSDIFQHVLNDAGLSPAECLYIDDTLIHVETARSLDIKGHHLVAPQRITDIL